jgi:hypothetical protein
MVSHHRTWEHLIDDAARTSLDHYEPPKKKHWWQF